MIDRRCANCQWWVAEGGFPERCKGSPPTRDPDGTPVWVSTSPSDWCAVFRPREDLRGGIDVRVK